MTPSFFLKRERYVTVVSKLWSTLFFFLLTSVYLLFIAVPLRGLYHLLYIQMVITKKQSHGFKNISIIDVYLGPLRQNRA